MREEPPLPFFSGDWKGRNYLYDIWTYGWGLRLPRSSLFPICI